MAKKDLREATAKDIAKIVALINEAYLPAEGFLYEGPRIDTDEVRGKLDKGHVPATAEFRRRPGWLRPCRSPRRGRLLRPAGRVHRPPAPRSWRKLIASAEAYFKTHACGAVEIDVVNHRQELFGFYGGLGYHVVGDAAVRGPTPATSLALRDHAQDALEPPHGTHRHRRWQL